MEIEKLVVITKKTDLELLLRRYGTRSQVKFILESRGQTYESYFHDHQNYVQELSRLQSSLPKDIPKQYVERSLLPTFSFGRRDVILTLGDPGLVVNTAKYLQHQSLIAINPDPHHLSDVFTTCYTDQVRKVLSDYAQDSLKIEQLTMAKATTNTGEELYALNDFFIGQRTHVSAKYSIEHGGRKEHHSSSGIVVSTGAGSTGWYTSLRAGADRLQGVHPTDYSFSRESKRLEFVVREPFPSLTTGTDIACGSIYAVRPLYITSKMPENGVIFSDGVESDYIDFLAGTSVEIAPAQRSLQLVKYV